MLQIVNVSRSYLTSDTDRLIHGQGFANFQKRTLIHTVHLTSASVPLICGTYSKIIVQRLHKLSLNKPRNLKKPISVILNKRAKFEIKTMPRFLIEYKFMS
jgi:hypothetical protein